MDKKEKIEYEVGEDCTKYGEFISSYFAWVSLPEQKEKVEKLEEITKDKKGISGFSKKKEYIDKEGE